MKRSNVLYLISVISCLLLVEGIAFAQQRTDFTHNWGMRLGAERDEGYSPLNYDGVGVMVQAGMERSKEKRLSRAFLQFSFAPQTNNVGRVMNSYSAHIQTYSFYNYDTTRLFTFGWSNVNFFSLRDIKDLVNFNGRMDYFTTFGPAALFSYDFSLFKRRFTIEAPAQWSLLGFNVRSGFISSAPIGFETAEEDDSFFKTLNRSLRFYNPLVHVHLNVSPRLRYYFKNENGMGLQYDYSFTRLTGAHVSVMSRGMLSIQLFMKLSN